MRKERKCNDEFDQEEGKVWKSDRMDNEHRGRKKVMKDKTTKSRKIDHVGLLYQNIGIDHMQTDNRMSDSTMNKEVGNPALFSDCLF